MKGGKIRNFTSVLTFDLKDLVCDSVAFLNCNIENSTLKDSTIHEGKMSNTSMVGCVKTMSPLAFRKFAPEFRTMTFSKVSQLYE
jgi:hypothetical protein